MIIKKDLFILTMFFCSIFLIILWILIGVSTCIYYTYLSFINWQYDIFAGNMFFLCSLLWLFLFGVSSALIYN